jgi:hypothetical protein
MKRLLIVGMMFVAVLAGPVQAVEPVKIGMITTLSTKAGYLGEEIRDGFQLAIDQEERPAGRRFRWSFSWMTTAANRKKPNRLPNASSSVTR